MGLTLSTTLKNKALLFPLDPKLLAPQEPNHSAGPAATPVLLSGKKIVP